MKYFYPKYHTLHKPTLDLSDGLPGYTHLEVSSRVELVLEGLLSAYRAEVISVEGFAEAEVREIHDKDYVDFLLAIEKEIEGEYIPPLFRSNLSESPLYFQGGMYCSEIGTPIIRGSIQAALNSAQSVLEATEYLLCEEKNAFALTRPPGHHAGKRRYGGYCFFNNAYLAANLLNRAGKKVAVVDIDYHIGDGSLEFASKDAPYFSLHANISRNYPYLQLESESEHTYLKEFTSGISGEVYLEEVRALVEKSLMVESDVVLLSLGFDTLESDYTQDEYIYVKAEDFRDIGMIFGSLKQEVLILLEGGYDSEFLALCAENFMSGFRLKKGF